ncbi:competence/damage-inducible protein A [Bacillus sp. SCS-151]|uniref:competence/damage-inducible protein A n=1 Tax=Nanhaiella sioensis TaxID=3115293 RepID=UPI003978707E
MNAEIIAVGSELLLGQIANTNAQFLSKQLAELGINVYFHTVVGDNQDRLKRVVETAKQRSKLIIFTGGLGPTKDDLTKETMASMLQQQLVIHEKSLKRIEAYYEKVNRKMTDNNKKQAVILEKATVLLNDHGMAPGMAITKDHVTYMLLPGPPMEMQPMFLKYGTEYLNNLLGVRERIISRVLRFFGIGESKLETEIEDLIDKQVNPTIAPLASNFEVKLRLTAKHSSVDKANELLDDTEQEILSRVGQYFYGYENTSLLEHAVAVLQEKKLTIASAESLTGGMFMSELIAVPGSSSVAKGGIVAYTNDMKETLLNVNRTTLIQEGAVSKECAQQMAEHVRKSCNSDCGISFTGVAGPQSVEGKDIGTVFIGLSIKDHPTEVYSLKLAGSRQMIRERAIKYGYYYLLKQLKK